MAKLSLKIKFRISNFYLCTNWLKWLHEKDRPFWTAPKG